MGGFYKAELVKRNPGGKGGIIFGCCGGGESSREENQEALHGTGVLKNGNEYLLRPVCGRPLQLPSYVSQATIPNHPLFTAQETEVRRG